MYGCFVAQTLEVEVSSVGMKRGVLKISPPCLRTNVKFQNSKLYRLSFSRCEHNSIRSSKLNLIVQHFELGESGVTFGYGSGVFEQSGYEKAKPQVDFIHIVDDPMQFHKQNWARHPEHYSSLLQLGWGILERFQTAGAGVYFNPYVQMKDMQGDDTIIKYGVVSIETALLDLDLWQTMYIAGRLQKPVAFFGLPDWLKAANQRNLASALNLGILLLASRKKQKTQFTPSELFEEIALISYMGDPRMMVGGENPNKVKNIVSKQLELFKALYKPHVDKLINEGLLQVDNNGDYKAKLSDDAVAMILSSMPQVFKQKLLKSYYETSCKKQALAAQVHHNQTFVGPFMRDVGGNTRLRMSLVNSLRTTIAWPALIQSLKGIFTAGFVKSARYAWEKKLKSWTK